MTHKEEVEKWERFRAQNRPYLESVADSLETIAAKHERTRRMLDNIKTGDSPYDGPIDRICTKLYHIARDCEKAAEAAKEIMKE